MGKIKLKELTAQDLDALYADMEEKGSYILDAPCPTLDCWFISGQLVKYRPRYERPAGETVFMGPALILFGLSLLVSLFGVFVGAGLENFARIYDGTPGKWCFAVASLVFLAGVLFTIVVPVLT